MKRKILYPILPVLGFFFAAFVVISCGAKTDQETWEFMQFAEQLVYFESDVPPSLVTTSSTQGTCDTVHDHDVEKLRVIASIGSGTVQAVVFNGETRIYDNVPWEVEAYHLVENGGELVVKLRDFETGCLFQYTCKHIDRNSWRANVEYVQNTYGDLKDERGFGIDIVSQLLNSHRFDHALGKITPTF